MSDATETLTQLAALGPFFTVRSGNRTDGHGFLPLRELYQTETLTPPVREYARRMGTEETRVAASTLQLALASRLWSVTLGSAVLTGRVPDVAPERLRWRLRRGEPFELWLPEARHRPDPPRGPAAWLSTADGSGTDSSTAGAAHTAPPPVPAVPALVPALHTAVAEDHLRPLNRAVQELCGLSAHTLHGNAASALTGALRVLLNHAPGTFRTATALTEGLLAREPLHDTGEFIAEEGLGTAFVRRSCCLYYRVAGRGGVCGDCVLRERTTPG